MTQYLSAEAVNNTLEFVSGVSGIGSVIVFTYVRQGIIDGTDRPEWFQTFLSFAFVTSPFSLGLNSFFLTKALCN